MCSNADSILLIFKLAAPCTGRVYLYEGSPDRQCVQDEITCFALDLEGEENTDM